MTKRTPEQKAIERGIAYGGTVTGPFEKSKGRALPGQVKPPKLVYVDLTEYERRIMAQVELNERRKK